MCQTRWQFAAAAILVGFSWMTAMGDPQNRSAETDASAMLDKTRQFLAAARTIQVEIRQSNVSTNPRGRMEIQQTIKLEAEQPNKINIVTSSSQGKLIMDGEVMSPPQPPGEEKQFRVVGDGRFLYSFWQDTGRYTKDPAPKNFGGAFDRWSEISQIAAMPEEIGLVGLLLFAERFPGEAGVLSESKFVGEEEIDGQATHQLHFVLQPKPQFDQHDNKASTPPFVLTPSASKVSFDVWIDRGERPIIRKLKSEFTPVPGKWNALPADMQFENITMFENWRIDESVPAQSFSFKQPEDAKEVVSLIVPGSGWPLIGNPIPAFKLNLLGGGLLDTAQLKGRFLVFIFRNGNQGPGNGGLPAIMYFASQFNNRGVATYLINARDDEESMKRFLATHNWNAPMAIDRDGSVSQPYIGDIPDAVAVLVIGKDGNVQATHGDLIQDAVRLRAELEALTTGKKIIEEEAE